MIVKDTIIKEIVNRTSVTCKRTVSKKDIERVVTSIVDTIEQFNLIPEYTVMFMDRPLSDIIIPNEFKDLVEPESVRLDPTDIKTSNLLNRLVAVPSTIGYGDWINLLLEWRSFFKDDIADKVTDLASLRQPKSLFDTLPIASFNGRVRSIDDPFIPVDLVPEISVLFREDYLNADAEQIVKDYFAKWMI